MSCVGFIVTLLLIVDIIKHSEWNNNFIHVRYFWYWIEGHKRW